MDRKKLSREAIAGVEIGHTEISRMLTVILSVFFLLWVFSVPAIQYLTDWTDGTAAMFSLTKENDDRVKQTLPASIFARNKTVLKNIHELESFLEDNSLLRRYFLPPLQYVFLRFFGYGNDKALPGRDDWLFFFPAVDYLVGQPFLNDEQLQVRRESHEIWENPLAPDPRAAIVDFKKQLEARGIALLIVPVPVKAAIHPERLSRRPVRGPLANRSYSAFLSSMEQEGVRVFDARSILAGYARNHGDAFLAVDTHWLPGAMQAVAGGLAAYVKSNFPAFSPSLALQLHPQQIQGEGDIARMVTLPANKNLFPVQRVLIEQVLSEENLFWQPDRWAEILLLGDSFTNIYSLSGLGWGGGGGLAEHFSYAMQHPLDLLARNDGGAYATREMLAAELGRGRDRLAGKKLVIWQFAERELALGNWKKIAMVLTEGKESGFYEARPGEKISVTGTVEAISRSPRPGSVPYRDNIVTIHLVDLQSAGRKLETGQALVYGWGMQDNKLSPLAGVRPGDSLSLSLSSWQEVEGIYGSYRRTPLDDEMLELEIPNWGTVLDEDNR